MTVQMSRSEQKRRIKQLEKLVVELSSLPPSMIDQLPCTEEVRDLLKDAVSMKGGARNRHVKYITKVLKDTPVEELYSFLTKRKGKDLQENKAFHEVEYLRDSLLNEAIEQHRIAAREHEELEEDWFSETARKISDEYPGIDTLLLKRLAWLYVRTRNRKHSRELFRIIRAAHEQEGFVGKNSGINEE